MDRPGIKLNTGTVMPAIGFGTWQLSEGSEARGAVTEAIKAGYRLVDTAKIYGNEQSVGQAINQSGINREELFVTTKLWPTDYGYVSGLKAFENSLDKLGLEYLDLYLLHWPDGPKRREAWPALEKIYKDGRSKAVGVSNFNTEQLKDFLKNFKVVPAVNQIEFHPFIFNRQKPVLDFCQARGIIVEAYSPLTVGRNISHPGVTEVAKHYDKSNAQVILRWCVQHQTVPIPRSTNPSHVSENLDIFEFELSGRDMAKIDGLSDDGWQPNQM